MDASLTSLASHRFSVSVAGKQVDMNGVLFSGTGFDRYSDIFSTAEKISLKNIIFASWAGIDEFLTFLGKFEKPFRLEDIREPLFEMIVLQLASAPAIALGRFAYLPLAKLQKDHRETEILDLEATLGTGDRNTLVNFERAYLGSPSHFIAHYLKNRTSQACKAHLEELNSASGQVSYLYLCFLHTIVRTTLNQVQTIACSSLRSSLDIMGRIEGIDRGLTLLTLQPQFQINKKSFLGELENEFSPLTGLLFGLRTQLVNLVVACKEQLAQGQAPSFTASALIGSVTALAGSMREFAAVADQVGVAVASAMMPLACGGEILAKLKAIGQAPQDTALLEELSNAFCVVDAFAAESWNNLLPEIQTELDILDSMVMNASIEIQGLDAAKQVLEKRIKEIEFLKNLAAEQNPLTEASLENEFINCIAGKLVTVQERMSFAALLGAYKNIEQDLMDTQEVSFF